MDLLTILNTFGRRPPDNLPLAVGHKVHPQGGDETSAQGCSLFALLCPSLPARSFRLSRVSRALSFAHILSTEAPGSLNHQLQVITA